MARRKEIRFAKHPCRAKVQDGQSVIHCFALARVVNTDGKFRYGTLKCINGHEVKGKAAELNWPVRRGR